MARKSERLSSSAKATPTHKRAASSTIAAPSAQGKRSKKATPTKSQYFQAEDDQDAPDDNGPNEESTAEDEDASDFGDEDEDPPSSDGEDDDEGDGSDDDEPKSRKKSTARKGGATSHVIRTKGKELWRPGVKAGLGPGTQVVIKKPKARPAGKVPYSDETIHPNTLSFLEDLKANNDRQWLKNFRASEKDWHSFVEKLTERLIEIDDTVPELPVKDIVFRIYRDIRFSSDPTPYKPYFSAAWSRTGRKGPYAHYYVQVSPNETFVGGGLWHPEAAPTAAMRRDIDLNPERIKNILTGDGVRKAFLNDASKQETKVVKAFVASNAANALKTKPKGYDAGHADIDLLRLRNYTIGRKLTDKELLGTGGMDRIADLLSCMKPFITYLNEVVMPDEAPESSDSGDSDEEYQSGTDTAEGAVGA